LVTTQIIQAYQGIRSPIPTVSRQTTCGSGSDAIGYVQPGVGRRGREGTPLQQVGYYMSRRIVEFNLPMQQQLSSWTKFSITCRGAVATQADGRSGGWALRRMDGSGNE
jgi:hypothetical protein